MVNKTKKLKIKTNKDKPSRDIIKGKKEKC